MPLKGTRTGRIAAKDAQISAPPRIAAERVVVVSGERHAGRHSDVRTAFTRLGIGPGWVVVHGAAFGVDLAADQIALELGARVVRVPVSSKDFEQFGDLAAFERNSRMLREHPPEIVLAFPGPRSQGTRDMIRKARHAGIPIEICWRHGQVGDAEAFEA